MLDGAIIGEIAEIGFATSADDTVALIDSEIDKYIEAGFTSITLLTCKTEESSIIADYCRDSKYILKHGYIKFTTCRIFKGLESDVIILVDMDKDTFENCQGEQLMYVGASRARYKLSCIVNMTETDCEIIMKSRKIKYNRNILKSFATAINAKVMRNK